MLSECREAAGPWTDTSAVSRQNPVSDTGSACLSKVKGTGGAESIAFGSGADGIKHPIVTRNKVGAGAVIVTLVPHMTGLDER